MDAIDQRISEIESALKSQGVEVGSLGEYVDGSEENVGTGEFYVGHHGWVEPLNDKQNVMVRELVELVGCLP